MGGVRNGDSELDNSRVEQHLQVAFRLLRERQAPKAFGELVRASRSLPMTRRLASALVAVSLKAGTEAAAITLLSSALDKTEAPARKDIRRQLARVLRRVEQLPRAIEALEAQLAAFPEDHGSRRVLQLLLERTGKWEALVLSLEREAQDAFLHREYYRAARAARWRARILAEQLRNLARAAESYGQAANYLEQMEDAVGAFSVRLDGLRVLHASGASEPVLTAAASVCMSAAARLGRDTQARQVLEELGLIPKSAPPAAPAPPPPSEAPVPLEAHEPRSGKQKATVEMSLPLLQAMLAASTSGQSMSAPVAAAEPPAPPAPLAAPVEEAVVQSPAAALPAPSAPVQEVDDSDGLAAPEDASQEEPHGESEEEPEEEPEEESLMDSEGAPLTELFEIPDEEFPHSAPPVAAAEEQAEEEEDAESEEPPAGAVDDEAAQQRAEAQLIARKAWRELAQFYLARADRAKEPLLRAEALSRLAELMENELGDPSGAAGIYREIVSLTGDREALKEQVRLVAQRGDASLVRRALDEAVQSARTPKARAAAYLTRAERSLEVGEQAQAKTDFETAEALTPGMLLVLAGLVRCVPAPERSIMANRLRAALSAAPRRSPDRLDALQVLASVAEDSLKDARLAQWAWTEVLAEEPAQDHARTRLLELARTLGDKKALSQLVREQLAREPRGPAARLARMELVAALEDTADVDGALTELRQAVRFEPGHKEAWLLLADRLTERGQIGEAAWALDNAASAMEDESERLRTWLRLASFCHSVLKDPARAEMYSRRAENLRRSSEDKSAPPVPEVPVSPAPRRDPGTGVRTQLLIPPPSNVELTPSGQSFPPVEQEQEIVTDLHTPAAAREVADDARPTIEFSAVTTFPGGKMPFDQEEATASEAPEGFLPPEPAKPAAAKKNLGKKLKIEPPDPSRELDSLMGGDPEEADHTSPSLSAWNIRRPPGLSKPPKEGPPPPAPPVPGKAAARAKKGLPTQIEVVAPPPPPVLEAPPPRAVAPSRADTAPGRRAATNPPPPPPPSQKKAPAAQSEPAVSKSPPPARRKEATGSADSAFAQVSPGEPDGPPAPTTGPVQHTSFISWEAPPGKMEPVRRSTRARGVPAVSPKAPPLPPAEQPGAEPAVFKQVREYPLDEELYLQIAEYFESRGDLERAELMREIADALDNREGPAPRPPRQPLSPDDRSGLRHPALRSSQGELLTCVGVALCRLFPTHGRAAGTQEPLRPNLGAGAATTAEALEATQRLLGIQAPEVVLSEDNGPPFSLVFTTSPRVLVGKQAVRQVLPAAELRFYAGRALICLEPDLLALRSLKKDQVLRGLALLSSVLKDAKSNSLEARVARETLTPRQLERAAVLFGPATRQFEVAALADAARDSANRAGLIACGAVGPALAALKMKRALEREVVELVRFAASERYFQLRTR
jgi:tetratricopeptide (TPR) repeat protein